MGLRSTAIKFSQVSAMCPPGYELGESGVPRGEVRWYHVTKDGVTIKESPSLTVIAKYIEKLPR